MNNINYSTVEKQIEKLKKQNLSFHNENDAKYQLQLYGYFNLIKGYRDPYIIKSDNALQYRTGVSFEQITSLYILDKNIRSAVISAMLDLEEHLKASAAEVIARSFGTNEKDYLLFKNYKDKKKSNKNFSLGSIMDKMKTTLLSGKDPVKHYREEHGTIPPWVLFKNVYFSTIINFVDLFKTPEREQLVSYLYDVDSLQYDISQLKTMMMDSLFICLEYRNLAAHGGRIYNYYCSKQMTKKAFPQISDSDIPKGMNLLLFILYLFKYDNPYQILHTSILNEVNRHLENYPEDITYLGHILNLDFVKQEIGWISGSSNIYHNDPTCSGINNAIPIPIDDLKQNGCRPCKKCFK
ncbi:MAG: Abi family protein [Eubacterium sp.]|nr:Abi family protein [Eubacterium sp.]